MGKKKVGNLRKAPTASADRKKKDNDWIRRVKGKKPGLPHSSRSCARGSDILVSTYMSTVAEIREAIGRLNESERYLLFAELLTTFQEPDEDDPEILAKLDPALEESKSGRCY
jgi:hypothetical protein